MNDASEPASDPRLERPTFVSTVWFEPGGAKRHAACRCDFSLAGRVRLRHLDDGTTQADISLDLFRTLIDRGLIRPLDEIPTRPTNRVITV